MMAEETKAQGSEKYPPARITPLEIEEGRVPSTEGRGPAKPAEKTTCQRYVPPWLFLTSPSSSWVDRWVRPPPSSLMYPIHHHHTPHHATLAQAPRQVCLPRDHPRPPSGGRDRGGCLLAQDAQVHALLRVADQHRPPGDQHGQAHGAGAWLWLRGCARRGIDGCPQTPATDPLHTTPATLQYRSRTPTASPSPSATWRPRFSTTTTCSSARCALHP